MIVETVFIVPLCICATVSFLLVLIFRSELKTLLRELFCTIIVHGCIFKEVVKDYVTRKNNTLVAAAPHGRVAVVTGARGIGFEVIKKLMEKNLDIIIGCRDVATGVKAVANIRDSGVTLGSAKVYRLDLSSLELVKSFAEEVLRHHPEVHILVNNAGVSLDKRTLTDDGIERTFATNYLGHCYLTHLLLARLANSARTSGINARIVNVCSVAYCFPFLGRIHFKDLTLRDNYQEYAAYSQSKLAQLMFTKTLDAKLRTSNVPVRVFALHPGIANTDIISNSFLHRLASCLFPLVLRTPEEGARSVYYACASSDLESRGGAYIYSCVETPVGKSACTEDVQAKMWTTMMDLLRLQTFGNIL